MNFRIKLIFALTIPFLLFSAIGFGLNHTLLIGNFSASETGSGLPEGWEPFRFKKIKRHTRYRLVTEDNTVVVKAESDAAASGLIRKIRIKPENYKFISWRWKISNILIKEDTTKKKEMIIRLGFSSILNMIPQNSVCSKGSSIKPLV